MANNTCRPRKTDSDSRLLNYPRLTRRHFIAAFALRPPDRVAIPIHRIVDSHNAIAPAHLYRFWAEIWPEAWRTFASGGIDFRTTDGPGEIRKSPGDRPIFLGLRPGVLNLVLTDRVPLLWDGGQSLGGVATLYGAYPLCLIALRYARPNRVPIVAVNTLVHELLHALMQDIFITNPPWYQAAGREARIDMYATRLWLFHEGVAIRESARIYLRRLEALREALQ